MQVISTINGIRGLLKRECKKAGGIAKWAKKYGFGRSYITEVISGKYDPTKSERLMEALELEETGVWYKIDEKPTRKEIKEFLIEEAEKKKKLGKMYDWKDKDFNDN